MIKILILDLFCKIAQLNSFMGLIKIFLKTFNIFVNSLSRMKNKKDSFFKSLRLNHLKKIFSNFC